MLVEVQRFYQPCLLDLILHSGEVLDAVAVLDLVILGGASGLTRGHSLEALHVQGCRGVHELTLTLDLVIEVVEPLKSIQLPALSLLLDHLWREDHDLGISVSVGHVRGAGVLPHLGLVGRLGLHDLASPAMVTHLKIHGELGAVVLGGLLTLLAEVAQLAVGLHSVDEGVLLSGIVQVVRLARVCALLAEVAILLLERPVHCVVAPILGALLLLHDLTTLARPHNLEHLCFRCLLLPARRR